MVSGPASVGCGQFAPLRRPVQSAALKLWSKDMAGNFAAAQQTVYARAKDNGLAALGRWKG